MDHKSSQAAQFTMIYIKQKTRNFSESNGAMIALVIIPFGLEKDRDPKIKRLWESFREMVKSPLSVSGHYHHNRDQSLT